MAAPTKRPPASCQGFGQKPVVAGSTTGGYARCFDYTCYRGANVGALPAAISEGDLIREALTSHLESLTPFHRTVSISAFHPSYTNLSPLPPVMNTVDEFAIQTMKRAALQRLAKEKGVRAVGPDEQIRAALLELFTGGPSTSKESTEEDGKNEGVLQDVKNRIIEGGSQVHHTGTRRSTRLTVTKQTSLAPSKEDGDDGGHKAASRKVLGPLAQAPSSEPSDEFRAKFDAALTLAGLKLRIRVCGTMKPSATDLLAAPSRQNRKRKVDDGAQEGALRPSQKRCRPRRS
ncbi:hypothetical protein V8D89_003332 [Ganoderma adspersum]